MVRTFRRENKKRNSEAELSGKKILNRFAKACVIAASVISIGALGVRCGPDECVPNLAPTDCRSTEPAQGVVTADNPLQMGNLFLYLEQTEEHEDMMMGIFRIEDSCGNVLMKEKIGEGQVKTFVIEGVGYEVALFALHPSEEGTEWADVAARLSCPPSEMCLLVSGVLNQGEALLADNFKVRLDDIDTDSGTALLSILDDSDNVLERLSVPGGQSVSLPYDNGYMLNVLEVAMGDTFGAKWARIEVYSRNCD